MHISFDIDPFILILLGLSLLFTLILIFWEYYNYKALRSSASLPASTESACNGEAEGVSVVVYANNDTARLAQNLPLILEQDYPLFEVIVVNDGANESTKDLLEDIERKYDNLYYTFTPDDARNLSRKKLSLMLGIKAAKYGIILTTSSNCSPQSQQWISSMARHFSSGADVVIGHSRLAHGSDKKRGNMLRSFLSLADSVKYLVQAIRRKPYRGTSDNLAYRKSLFFKNKGFSRSMHLHSGEDDLFVNEITTRKNTHVELSPESIMVKQYDLPAKMFQLDRIRHEFTSRLIRTSAFVIDTIRTCIYALNLITILATIAIGYKNIVTIAVPISLAIATIVFQIIYYHKVAQILQSRKLSFSVPLLTLFKPVANFYYKLKSRRHTSYNYTWQPLKN